MLAEIPAQQFAMMLDDCAREVLSEAGVVQPPVDALEVAGRLGMVVARNAALGTRARFVRIGGHTASGLDTILLADEPRAERRHWAVAHEIGESVAHRVFHGLGIAPEFASPSAREQVANHLASCLLLPRAWFAADGCDLDWDLLELKQRYNTASHELVARRMLEMSPPVIITLFDQGKPQWRRSNLLARPPRLTVPELETWRTTFEQGESGWYAGHDLPVGVVDVRCWAVHEPGWRREILRTEVEEVF